MKFSIIGNTRGRPQLLGNMLNSVVNNADDKDLEILLYVDSDDAETVKFLETTESLALDKTTAFVKPRCSKLLANINYLATHTKGQYIFILNDDSEIVTPHWDTIALQKIEAYKKARKIQDDIIYGFTSDTSVDRNKEAGYASFPIISKAATDVIGKFMYDEFVGLGGDSSIYRVYKAIDRIVDISEITVDHVYHNTLFKVMSPDQTAHEMRQNTANNFVDPYTFDVSKEVEKLKNHIAKYGKPKL